MSQTSVLEKAQSLTDYFAEVQRLHPGTEIVVNKHGDDIESFRYRGEATKANFEALARLYEYGKFEYEEVSLGSCLDNEFHFVPARNNDEAASQKDWLGFYTTLAHLLMDIGDAFEPVKCRFVVDIPPTIENAAVGVDRLYGVMHNLNSAFRDICVLDANFRVPHTGTWKTYLVDQISISPRSCLQFTVWPGTNNRETLDNALTGLFGSVVSCPVFVTVPAVAGDALLSRDQINHAALDIMLMGIQGWISRKTGARKEREQSASKRRATAPSDDDDADDSYFWNQQEYRDTLNDLDESDLRAYAGVRKNIIKCCGLYEADVFARLLLARDSIICKTVQYDADYGVQIITKDIRDDTITPKTPVNTAEWAFNALTTLDLDVFA